MGRSFSGRPICTALALFMVAGILPFLSACSSAPSTPYYSGAPSQLSPNDSRRSSPSNTLYPSGGVQVVEKALIAPTDSRSVVHEVGPLETIWRISKMYDVPIAQICQANGLQDGATIKIGQRLTIPNSKTFRNVIPLYPSNQWSHIVIHHTATEIGNASSINQNHNDRGFWKGLGYHFLIDNGTLSKVDGQIEVAPRWIKQQSGAHCKAGGMNTRGIGIALVGNFNHEHPTPKQLDSLAYLVHTLSQYYRIALPNVIGHRDAAGANTDCPGRLFPWTNLRQCIAGL